MNQNSTIINRLLYALNRAVIYVMFRLKGNDRKLCKRWIKSIVSDEQSDNGIAPSRKRWGYRRGFYSVTVKKWNINKDNCRDFVCDFRQMWLKPYNNSFDKWFKDRLTPYVILRPFTKHMPRLYAFALKRGEEHIVIPKESLDMELATGDIDEIFNILDAKGALRITSVSFNSGKSKEDNVSILLESAEDGYLIDGEPAQRAQVLERLDEIGGSFLIREHCAIEREIESVNPNLEKRTAVIHQIAVYVGTRNAEDSTILDFNVLVRNPANDRIVFTGASRVAQGRFSYKGRMYEIPDWEDIKSLSIDIAKFSSELSFMRINYAYREDGSFVIVSITSQPAISRAVKPSIKLVRFMEHLCTEKREMVKLADTPYARRKKREYRRWDKKKNRYADRGWIYPGIRTYMFMLWKDSVKDDFLHTRGYSLKQKIWAWKRGFLSFRITQYGLTEENYKDFLSDLQYHWLNRINNFTQKWINDKTTFRYALDPFKEYIPEYYFLVFKRGTRPCVKKLQDCDSNVEGSFEAIIDVLMDKGILVFKPSSGTHGDGFYKLEYNDGKFYVNEKEHTSEEIISLMKAQKSYYVVTDYVYMNKELARIYPKSLNTIRMMVINEDCSSPKVMQAYMRIGSSKTGFTDNVGYGGICVMVDVETGRMYNPEKIVDHKFMACPVHPDTDVTIEGVVPHWETIKSTLCDICRYFAELEYLGFDIAVTDEGFKIIEVNIHQDLHKVASHSDELRAYYQRKLAQKNESLQRS